MGVICLRAWWEGGFIEGRTGNISKYGTWSSSVEMVTEAERMVVFPAEHKSVNHKLTKKV